MCYKYITNKFSVLHNILLLFRLFKPIVTLVLVFYQEVLKISDKN